MKALLKPLFVVALALMLVAQALSALAQQGLEQEHLRPPQRAQTTNPTPEPAPPPQASHNAFYYRPGDLKGAPYDTIEECTNARQQAGDVLSLIHISEPTRLGMISYAVF